MTPISDDQIAALVDAADKATPGDLDSAEIRRDDEITCPLCGDGVVDRKIFTNIDGQAIGVEIFGVGEAFGHYEAFARLANPTTIRALASRVQAADAKAVSDAAVIAGLREEVGRYREALRSIANRRQTTSYDGFEAWELQHEARDALAPTVLGGTE